jgi:tRNA pseudouridine38-40 synthase
MPRYRLTIAYDGTEFHGWQKQQAPVETESLRTVQGVLEQAVMRVVRQPVSLLGASRTDAGVHALRQIAAFSAEFDLARAKLKRAINARLPADLRIRRVEVVADSFDPISDALAKGYRYRMIHDGRPGARGPVFARRYFTFMPETLDVERMQHSAPYFVGEHDFASFTRVHHGRETTVRTVHSCEVSVIGKRRLQIDISGNGFLYNMVRIIAGTLADVGRGLFEPDDIPGMLQARDRRRAGQTLPPEGLFLMWVRYLDSPAGSE